MSDLMRVLMLEDVPTDAELIERELKSGKFNFVLKHVDNKEAYQKGLKEFQPDLILSDYSLPQFTGIDALKITLEQTTDIPFIIVTGSMNEDTAVDCIKAGAWDYVIKEHLQRLNPAVNEAMELKRARDERGQAEEELRKSEERYRTTLDSMLEGCQIISYDWHYLYVNDIVARQGRREKEELLGHTMMQVYPGIEDTEMFAFLRRCMERRIPHRMENEFTFADGSTGWFDLSIQPVPDGIFILSLDITERKRSEEALKTSKEYTENLVGSSLDMIIAVDNNRRISEFNKAAEETFGYSREEILGKHVNILYADKKQGLVVHKMTVREGRHIQEVHNRRKNGEVFPSLLSSSVLVDSKGKRVGAMGVSRDITGRKQAEEEIRKLNEELEQRVKERTTELEAANEELESFSYSVSHDLRAPLRTIDGFSQILLEDYGDKLDSQGKDYLQRVDKGAKHMAQLTDDLLELSRVTRREMKRQAVDLSALAKEIAAELEKTQPERQVEFIIPKGLVANGDSRLLRVVLENLMGNAWKFTGTKPRAKIEFGVESVNGESAYFVKDNGAGFDRAYADKLFAPFQRLHSETEFEGTGIGLASVKRIIRRHGGQVRAESREGSGATFYFTLQQQKEE
ncbi:MAG: PAS domain S-box protein [Candidatus Neomarinimicrobiota bacterium]